LFDKHFDLYDRRKTAPRGALAPFAVQLCLLNWRRSAAGDLVLSSLAGEADPATFIQIAETVGLNRTLFVTIGGNLGIDPAEMLAGDEVCILEDAGMLLVLRMKSVNRMALVTGRLANASLMA
jgi:hypothetical protein